MRRTPTLLACAALAAVGLAVPAGAGAVPARPTIGDGPYDAASAARIGPAATGAAAGARRAKPLAGRTIVIDPGHQLGNSRHPRQINRLVSAGNHRKACNTTGTATNAGFAEATFTWRVATRLRKQLRQRGARVVMTRTRNSVAAWGPCVDVRGKLGNKGFRGRTRAADLKISIHGDGGARSGRGFHVIVASKKQGRAASTRYGRALRQALQQRGFRRADYIAGGDGYDVRSDLATLNLSRIPTAMVELGNMRNPRDAKVMRSAAGQRRYAAALTTASVRALRR